MLPESLRISRGQATESILDQSYGLKATVKTHEGNYGPDRRPACGGCRPTLSDEAPDRSLGIWQFRVLLRLGVSLGNYSCEDPRLVFTVVWRLSTQDLLGKGSWMSGRIVRSIEHLIP